MKHILPVIVISQFLCTSLWFAGNAIVPDIIQSHHLDASFLGHLTSAVQLGFIGGTLVFALLSISDRFSPSRVFFVCALLAASFNLGITLEALHPPSLLGFRFMTGFFLAGIYPVGMKIASDHFEKGLGLSLGYLVGALVLGTASPHLLKGLSLDLPWKFVLIATSSLATLGGLTILLFVPNGPFRKAGQRLNLVAFSEIFKNKSLKSAAFGYFGHMWELYTFWAFVPIMLATHPVNTNPSILAFYVIAAGGVACVLGGYTSVRFGIKGMAGIFLSLSGLCCLLSPLVLFQESALVLFLFLLFWGLVVIADSPLFSTLVAQNAPQESRGSILTLVNCIGFAITIPSIQLINYLSSQSSSVFIYLWLAIGPALGILALNGKSLK